MSLLGADDSGANGSDPLVSRSGVTGSVASSPTAAVGAVAV